MNTMNTMNTMIMMITMISAIDDNLLRLYKKTRGLREKGGWRDMRQGPKRQSWGTIGLQPTLSVKQRVVQRSSHQKIWEREGNCGKWRGHQRPRLHSAVAQGEEVLVIQKHLDVHIHSERLVYIRETILFTVTARFAHCFLAKKSTLFPLFSVVFNL